ncbi:MULTISPECIES: sulfurtransferase complex subunit TusB [unclassified Agarivorans]|uniref:sulfurtransferase complex subunit TusB n=1 Tax=unclassified Agarivorans TaxID=2636026 RepID=UPI003D7DB768
MLHIMRHSYASSEFQACIQQMDVDSHLVLIEDAVYALVKADAKLVALSAQGRLSVLLDDMQARGLKISSFNAIDYQQFVQLTVSHTPCLTW